MPRKLALLEVEVLASTVFAYAEELTPNEWRRVNERFSRLEPEDRIAAWKNATYHPNFSSHNIGALKLIHHNWANMVLEVFGVRCSGQFGLFGPHTKK